MNQNQNVGKFAFIGRGRTASARDNAIVDTDITATASYLTKKSTFIELVSLYYPNVQALKSVDPEMLQFLGQIALDCDAIFDNVWEDYIQTVGQGAQGGVHVSRRAAS